MARNRKWINKNPPAPLHPLPPPILPLQRLLQRLLGLDGGRGDQPRAAEEEREGEEEKQRLRGGRRQEAGREEGEEEGEGGQRRRATKEEEAKGEEQGWPPGKSRIAPLVSD